MFSFKPFINFLVTSQMYFTKQWFSWTDLRCFFFFRIVLNFNPLFVKYLVPSQMYFITYWLVNMHVKGFSFLCPVGKQWKQEDMPHSASRQACLMPFWIWPRDVIHSGMSVLRRPKCYGTITCNGTSELWWNGIHCELDIVLPTHDTAMFLCCLSKGGGNGCSSYTV